MATFANGATINLTLDDNDTITWDGTGKATITTPSGVQVMMLERAQTLGPFVGGATATLNSYTPGSYTVNPYSDANALHTLAAELESYGLVIESGTTLFVGPTNPSAQMSVGDVWIDSSAA